ncbi:histidinol-phosphate transaminase [Tomitella cavernea]|uniref:histidinol-phosphate transaminase n=1 Tax=Tomitella cavernea TaxID=1387982 RepID=UPI0027DE0B66|nr:histidinol-phosphate transaminase [Tomitella cavernea]
MTEPAVTEPALPRTRPDLDALPPYVPGRTVPGAVKLASNETTAGPLPSVARAIAEAAATANRYPDSGAAELTSRLAARAGVPPGSVAVGCGSVGLCQQLVQATCAPGDEVVFAWRSFEAYPIVTQVALASPVPVPLDGDDAHDLDAMAAAVTDRTRVVFLCNPNNPTGTFVGEKAIEEFLAKIPPHVVVALDEAYIEYARPGDGRTDTPDPALPDAAVPDSLALARRHPNVLILRTFSKAYGLAGVRVGYAIGHPSLIGALRKVFVPFSVSTLAQAAALACLDAEEELLERTGHVVAERGRMAAALAGAGYLVAPSAANFLWLPLGARSAEYSGRSADAKVIIRPYGDDGVRITVGTPEENDAFLAFATGAEALRIAGM